MANLPIPQSYETILGTEIDVFKSKVGVQNLKIGSSLLSLLEASARSDARGSTDIFQLLGAISLDTATDVALDREGAAEDLPRIQQSPASGVVNVTDTSFTKVSTTIFQGLPAPIAGSTTIAVTDASAFPATGLIYLGRGTADYEGPIPYTAKTNVGSYWTLTLSSGTANFHNNSEPVVLAQGGNRVVGSGQVVQTPQANVSNAVQFSVLYDYTLADGETSLPNVQVVALQPGIIGNIPAGPAGGISAFTSPPFTGASVTNPLPFSNGLATELDDDYRERIRDARRTKATGTPLALTTAVVGATSPDENKQVQSASVVRTVNGPSTLYVDDGTGYEEQDTGVPIEILVDSAVGGEMSLQTAEAPIAQAHVTTVNQSPYNLLAGSELTVAVGGVASSHSFSADQFTDITNASAYEVAASINGNPNISFSARTSGGGAEVVLFARSAFTNEDIAVLPAVDGVDANSALAFPNGVNYTLKLYKNDVLLSKDGKVAAVTGNAFSTWASVTGTQTLVIAVDNTPTVTYSFNAQDFIDADTGYVAVGRNSLLAWAAVLNAKIPGITATVNSGRLVITSNVGTSARASVVVSGGTLVGANFFGNVSAVGAPSDYVLDPNRGQIDLATPLQLNDRLTIGSPNTRAFLQSSVIPPTTLASVAKLWFVVDGDAQIIQTGVDPSTNVSVSVTKLYDWGHYLAVTASSGTPFQNVEVGDWIIIWDPALDPSLRGAFRVAVATATVLTVERRSGTGVRLGHQTVALKPTGSATCKVLTCGGSTSPTNSLTLFTPVSVTDTASVYDPNTSTSSPVAPMNHPRAFHGATLLSDGTVLVVGGTDDSGAYLTSIEVYDPIANTWTVKASALAVGTNRLVTTLLANGRVLITGGILGTTGLGSNSFYVYDPVGDTFTSTGTLAAYRGDHRAVLLPNSDVLIVGGIDNVGSFAATAEIWSHTTLLSTATGSMHRARANFGLSLVGLTPTTVLAIGNETGSTGNTSYEVYSIAGGTWGAETTIPNNVTFEAKDVTHLTNGHVVGLHGFSSAANATEVGFTYDGTTFTAISPDPLTDYTSGKWLTKYVELKNLSGSVKNIVVAVGGAIQLSLAWGYVATATVEQYDEVAAAWSVLDPAVTSSAVLTEAGLVAVRTNNLIREVDVPVGTNYSASTFAGVVNSETNNPGLAGLSLPPALVGATATIYQTTRVRVSTNTFSTAGDIALVAQDPLGSEFGLATGSAVHNLTPHLPSVESGSELGTPSFRDISVRAVTQSGSSESPVVDATMVDVASAVVGLKNWWRGASGSSTYTPASFYQRNGSNYGFRTRLLSQEPYTDLTRLDQRDPAVEPWTPLDRLYLASPFAIGPDDDLNVAVDADPTKTYAIKMSRTLATIGNTYSQTNAFTDADGGGSIQSTFGSSYDFNDFSVYMASRAIAFSGDSSRSLLFRYYRLGPDGDGARVRFGNPVAVSAPLSVGVTQALDTTDVTIRLASGAARTLGTRNTTNLGQSVTAVDGGGIATIIEVVNLHISSAVRTSNVTTLTLTLPPGVTDHGLVTTNTVWVNSTNGSFSSGLKTITGRSATTIQYTEVAADVGATPNIGDVSNDNVGEATFAGSSTAVGDWFRFSGPTGLTGYTFRITALDSNNGYVVCASGDQVDGNTLTVNTTLTWVPVSTATNLQVWINTPQTVTAIAAAVNALEATSNSTVPVTATVIGTGSGTIGQSTPDFLDSSVAWYVLSDGVNWVKTTILPGSNYQLVFKNPINGTLSSNADWQHEVIKVVPTTTKNVVEWLNTPVISGLFTAASVQASSDGTKVQIASLTAGSLASVQVDGGLSNALNAVIVGSATALTNKSLVTVKTTDASAIHRSQWCRIDNNFGLPNFSVFTVGENLVSWDAAGLVRFSGSVFTNSIVPTDVRMRFEHQGDFVAISDMGIDGDDGLRNKPVGSWIRIGPTAGSPIVGMPQVSEANQGLFRVVRTAGTNTFDSAGTVYIYNPDAVDEAVQCNVSMYSGNSVVPGDKFIVQDPVFGAANQGTWTVKAVGETSAGSGDDFANTDRFTVDVSSQTPLPQTASAALTPANATLVYIVEGTPATFVMQVDGVAPNQTDGNFTDIRWDDAVHYSGMGAVAGSVITVLDKLDFPTTIATGIDGYQYGVGLIGEANRILYGDPDDTATYPGKVSEGARVGIRGPLIRRVQLSLQIRVKSGVSTSGITSRVQSAAATVVNQSQLGVPTALSTVSAAVAKVVGVTSVVPPSYNSSNDLISVAAAEKARVINLSDIQVAFIGN